MSLVLWLIDAGPADVSARARPDPLLDRVAALARALAGREVRNVIELPAGLGARRFLRISFSAGQPESMIARVEAVGSDPHGARAPEPPLEPIRGLLERCGLPVPARHGVDHDTGIEFLEDLGDTSLETAAAHVSTSERFDLYRQAVGLIPRIQAVQGDPAHVAAFARHLDRALIETKAQKWLEWTIPFVLGRDATPAEKEATRRAFQVTSHACEQAEGRLAHRDYKAANLHVIRARGMDDGPRLVMIDLQGAFLAPPEYDLMCLLRDSHVVIPEQEVRTHLDEVRPSLPDPPSMDEFERRFDLLTLVRVAKDISHFVDAFVTREDDRYLRFVPTGMKNLRAAAERARLRDDAIVDFADWLGQIPDVPTSAPGTTDRRGTACAP